MCINWLRKLIRERRERKEAKIKEQKDRQKRMLDDLIGRRSSIPTYSKDSSNPDPYPTQDPSSSNIFSNPIYNRYMYEEPSRNDTPSHSSHNNVHHSYDDHHSHSYDSHSNHSDSSHSSHDSGSYDSGGYDSGGCDSSSSD